MKRNALSFPESKQERMYISFVSFSEDILVLSSQENISSKMKKNLYLRNFYQHYFTAGELIN